MRRLRIWHLLVSFHMSVRCTICMEHWINHLAPNLLTTKLLPANLLSADLLPKIHWVVGHSQILEPRVDLSLLKSSSLMILLGHLRKTCYPSHPLLAFIGIGPADDW